MEVFITTAAFFALAMLVWDCVEVGRNDAANLVNAAFGARVFRRRTAVWVAGAAVIAGATFSTPVMETVRKGIFDPSMLTLESALTVYISVYIVDTILLYSYSAFGMPVSTTACLVFELVGAALGVHCGLGGGFEVVHWDKVGTVVLAIIMSIFLSGLAGFLIQRVLRGAIRDKAEDRETVLLHGPWIAGLLLTMLLWFMMMKGLKGVECVKLLRREVFDAFGAPVVLLVLWGGLTLLVHLALVIAGERGTRYLFHVTTVIGMLCMSFSFGQNDLANCASPGLSSLWLWKNSGQTVAMATQVPIPVWALFGCGVLMVFGMRTRNAQRVTRAEVNTGSQFDHVALWAPRWCRSLARFFIGKRKAVIAPAPATTKAGKKIHYDTLRASVIMAVSASVIAFSSGRGLPVSTTYVAFATVVATGWADRVFLRGDADLKLGRAIWVVFSWFLAAFIAMAATAVVARIVLTLGAAGLFAGLGANLGLRFYFGKRSDLHEKRYHQDFERSSPEAERPDDEQMM